MLIQQGDLIHLAKQGVFDVIVHGCNCFCSMDGGIARAIKIHFPEAYHADCATAKGDREKLGTISSAEIPLDSGTLTIINAYCQYHYSGKMPLIEYWALRSCFREIATNYPGLRIGYPKIGAGLAGGSWAAISPIIDAELTGQHHTLVIFNRS